MEGRLSFFRTRGLFRNTWGSTLFCHHLALGDICLEFMQNRQLLAPGTDMGGARGMPKMHVIHLALLGPAPFV